MSGTPRTRSLDKAVVLLRAVAEGRRSASALGRATGIPRATVTRTIRTLADAGFVEETDDGWVLGYELVRLGRAADPHGRLIRLARPVLEQLRSATGESALLGVPRDPPGLDIIEQLDAPHLVGVASWVGTDVPLHASAAGKLVLAELDPPQLDAWLDATPRPAFTSSTITGADELRREVARVRRLGVAELVDELEDGLASLSAPVRDHARTLVGMLGVSAPSFRLTRARRTALRPVVAAAAYDLERRLMHGKADDAGVAPTSRVGRGLPRPRHSATRPGSRSPSGR